MHALDFRKENENRVNTYTEVFVVVVLNLIKEKKHNDFYDILLQNYFEHMAGVFVGGPSTVHNLRTYEFGVPIV